MNKKEDEIRSENKKQISAGFNFLLYDSYKTSLIISDII